MFLLTVPTLKFQSTQPEWAATAVPALPVRDKFRISIHAARVGCDKIIFTGVKAYMQFQSTQPEWAATASLFDNLRYTKISIHAARVGCDYIH